MVKKWAGFTSVTDGIYDGSRIGWNWGLDGGLLWAGVGTKMYISTGTEID